ncbi:MAG TPA: hypothetical protein VM053_12110 [Gemmatimonadaceae bacterium]|nr:hypothetical protein [Gemmatimonadaceae bacterium]
MSRLDIIRRYMIERYPARRFVVLAILLSGTGILAAPVAHRADLVGMFASPIRGALIAYLIVLAFRVWDDLEDRNHDVVAHPDRITVSPEATAPLRKLALMSGGAATTLFAFGVEPLYRLLICALLVIALAVWYRTRRSLSPSPVFAAHIVLAKYPVIAYLVAPGTLADGSRVAVATPVFIAIYLLLCIHEALDDPELFRSRFGRRVFVAESVLMVPLLGLVIASISHPQLLFGRGSLQ